MCRSSRGSDSVEIFHGHQKVMLCFMIRPSTQIALALVSALALGLGLQAENRSFIGLLDEADRASLGLVAHPAAQPRLGEPEIARHGVDVDLAYRRDLVLGQAAEVVQLGDPGLAVVELGELVERLVERH